MATLNEVAEVTEGEAPATAEDGGEEGDAEEGSGEGDAVDSDAAASEEGGSGEVRLTGSEREINSIYISEKDWSKKIGFSLRDLTCWRMRDHTPQRQPF